PTCTGVPLAVTMVAFQPDAGLAEVTMSDVVLCSSNVTEPAVGNVNVALFPTPGAAWPRMAFVPHMAPASCGAAVEAATGGPASVNPPTTITPATSVRKHRCKYRTVKALSLLIRTRAGGYT